MAKLLDRQRMPRAAVKGVRRRRPKDLAACARLLEVVFYDAHYPAVRPEPPRSWLAGEDVLDAWVTERLGEILGHVAISAVGQDSRSAFRWRETTGHQPTDLLGVSRFFVRPRVRGQGIGTALLDVAVAEVLRRGRVPVLEMVSARRDGIEILAKRNWRLIAADPWGLRQDDLRIYRYLAPSELIGSWGVGV